ncbi:MAG: DUF5681 domain-containing protein [Planctomycetota bacterium]
MKEQERVSDANPAKPAGREGNLVPWKKGQSGNPAGRPKGVRYLSEIYRELLQEVCPSDKRKRVWGEVIAERMFKEAIHGKRCIQAAAEIADRIDGKPRQAIEITPPPVEKKPEYDWSSIPLADRIAVLRILEKSQPVGYLQNR